MEKAIYHNIASISYKVLSFVWITVIVTRAKKAVKPKPDFICNEIQFGAKNMLAFRGIDKMVKG